MRFPSILLTLAIGLPFHIAGQTIDQSNDESGGNRNCRIVYPERPNTAPKVAFLFDGKENHQITLPSANFSQVVDLPSGDLTLLMTSSEITDLENLPPALPRLRVPEAVKEFYILVTPDPSNPLLPVKMNLVNVDGGKLGAGETLWFNLTEHRIAAKLGDSEMSVDPKGRTVSEDPRATSGYYVAEFAYQARGQGDFRRVTEQHWWHDAESRHLGFIVNTGGRLPRIYFFRDFR